MAASTAAPSTGRSTNPGKRTATASSPRSSANPAQTGAAARSRRSAQDKSPLSQTTALPARGAKPQSTKGKAPVSTTRDLPTPAPEQQPKGKLTDSQPAVAATKPKNAPAKPRRKSLQKGEPAAVPIKADEEDDGRCPACSSLSKGDDGTWVECDECVSHPLHSLRAACERVRRPVAPLGFRALLTDASLVHSLAGAKSGSAFSPYRLKVATAELTDAWPTRCSHWSCVASTSSECACTSVHTGSGSLLSLALAAPDNIDKVR